jgi:hypothetical protein
MSRPIGPNVRAALESWALGLSPYDAARKHGVSPSVVYRYRARILSGEPDSQAIKSIREYLNQLLDSKA